MFNCYKHLLHPEMLILFLLVWYHHEMGDAAHEAAPALLGPREEQQWLEGGVEVQPLLRACPVLRSRMGKCTLLAPRSGWGEGSVEQGCCSCYDSAGTCRLQCYLVAFQYFCGNETLPFTVIKVRLSYENKNLRHRSPEAMLNSETWFCEENYTPSLESWLLKVCSLIFSQVSI